MNYNITVEYVAVYIAILLGVFVSVNAVRRNRHTVLFICSVFSVAVCSAADIASVFLIEHYQTMPMALIHTVNVIYFLALAAECGFVTLYFLRIIDGNARFRHMAVLLPIALSMVISLSSPFTGLVYYFDENGYQRGPLNVVVFYGLVLYSFAVISMEAYKRRTLTTRHVKTAVVSFPLLMVLVLVVQFFNKSLLLEGLATIGPLILTYLFFENDVMDIDSETGFGRTESLIRHTARLFHKERPFVCVQFSLDNLKERSDALGREAVKEIFLRVNSQVERMLPKKSVCFRLSSSELAIVYAEPDPGRILEYAEKICNGTMFGKDAALFSVSAGAVSCPDVAQNNRELGDLLEYSMMQSRRAGENTVFVCDSETRRKVRRRKEIMELLKEELSSDENHFEVYYQPIFEIASGKFRTAEALVRLNETPIGPVYPDEFIPVAEEMGLIDRLGFIVLEKCCRFVAELMEEQVDFDAVSVNFSVHQIMRENIIDEIMSVVERTGIPPEKLRVEITESVVIEKFGHVKRIMEQLGRKGIKFYMDDFGTGYSNLSNMLELPFEYLKIDKSLVRGAEKSERTYSVLQFISKAFIGQNVKVLTEGVETEEQQRIVESLGASYIQGYLFAKPVPKEEAKEYFRGNVQVG